MYPENSLRVQEPQWSSLCAYRSHELRTVLLTYASNENKIYRLYIQKHKKNKLLYSQTLPHFHFFLVVSYSAEDQIFTTENFP
jgi:hypothetical protein